MSKFFDYKANMRKLKLFAILSVSGIALLIFVLVAVRHNQDGKYLADASRHMENMHRIVSEEREQIRETESALYREITNSSLSATTRLRLQDWVSEVKQLHAETEALLAEIDKVANGINDLNKPGRPWILINRGNFSLILGNISTLRTKCQLRHVELCRKIDAILNSD